MKTKPVLTAADVQAINAAAVAEAAANGWNVCITIVDDGGHALSMFRMDGAAPSTAMVSLGKAQTAAVGRKESGAFEKMINEGRYAFLSAPFTAMLEGGVPIIVDSQVIGAVGVSGVQSSQDAQIAKAGIAKLVV
ncbi:heme-binding protein [Pandoraea terrae]|uniref:Heme-binding protein n=1 Tax=Pandoraea terrae TaxID=1537710 RepID=A0A5E4VFF4_9BURK|nr:heme-binding protein [Pandoraea terrae]VVE11028.1 heme-binding protein [Pandoraea terrae]